MPHFTGRRMLMIGVMLAMDAIGFAQPAPQADPFASVRAIAPEDAALADYFTRSPQAMDMPLVPGRHTGIIVDSIAIPTAPIPKYEDFLREQVCKSDRVVVGRGLDPRTFVNRTATAIVTGVSLSATDWIRPLTPPAPEVIARIRIGQVGGIVVTAAGTTEFDNDDQPESLNLPHILFLQRVASVEAYVVRWSQRLEGTTVVQPYFKYRPGPLPTELASVDAAMLVRDLKAASATCPSHF